ncbi:NADPH-dependent FMN reductase [soil metagenome]
MITIISGTNRPDSFTEKFARIYFQMMEAKIADVKLLTLKNLPIEILSTDVYEKGKKPEAILKIQQEYFIPAEKFVFIFPEYNGSFPGILKLMMDVLDPKIAFSGKKAGLIGISTGRGGNLRGLDHLASVLHNMNVTVFPLMLPISKVQFEFDEEHQLKESALTPTMKHLEGILAF